MTSLFKFAPGATLTDHEHVGVEQTLLLDGHLVDKEGPAAGIEVKKGEFVWREPGSRHSAWSPQGGLTLAMMQVPNKFFDNEGQATDAFGKSWDKDFGGASGLAAAKSAAAKVAADKHSHVVKPAEMEWKPTRFPGCEVKTLLADPKTGLMTALMRFAPGAVLPDHEHVNIEQTYVLEGRLVDQEGPAEGIEARQGRVHLARARQPAFRLVPRGRADARDLPGAEQVLREGRPRHRSDRQILGRSLGSHRQGLIARSSARDARSSAGRRGGIGRRIGLKIRRGESPVPVRSPGVGTIANYIVISTSYLEVRRLFCSKFVEDIL